MNKGNNSRGRKIEVTGEVTDNSMNKTVSVVSYRLVLHKKYGKYMRKSSVVKAHDEKGLAKVGDKVKIVETRPLSKTKRWKVTEILAGNK